MLIHRCKTVVYLSNNIIMYECNIMYKNVFRNLLLFILITIYVIFITSITYIDDTYYYNIIYLYCNILKWKFSICLHEVNL